MNDKTAEKGWLWAGQVLAPILDTDIKAWDVAQAAVLIAYRAGLREGAARVGGPITAPEIEVGYSDSDITSQIERFDEAFAENYGWPITDARWPHEKGSE